MNSDPQAEKRIFADALQFTTVEQRAAFLAKAWSWRAARSRRGRCARSTGRAHRDAPIRLPAPVQTDQRRRSRRGLLRAYRLA